MSGPLALAGAFLLGAAILTALAGMHYAAYMMYQSGDYDYFIPTVVCLMGLDGGILLLLSGL